MLVMLTWSIVVKCYLKFGLIGKFLGSLSFYLYSKHLEYVVEFVRKIRLIQPKVITLKGGWIGWWSLFVNLNDMNTSDNYIQIYNKII